MNFVILKPCPPCCPNAPAGWQDVKVSDDFYSYSIEDELRETMNIANKILDECKR